MSGVAVRLAGFMAGVATHDSWTEWAVTKEGFLHLKADIDGVAPVVASFAPGQWSYAHDTAATPEVTNSDYPPPVWPPNDAPEGV